MSPSLSTKPRKESEVLAAVLDFLHSIRGMFERRNTGAMRQGARYVKFNEPGTPDITGILWPGIPFAVECKREGWRPTNEAERRRFRVQLDWLERWCQAGGVGIVSDNVGVVADWVTHAQRDRNEAMLRALDKIEQETLVLRYSHSKTARRCQECRSTRRRVKAAA